MHGPARVSVITDAAGRGRKQELRAAATPRATTTCLIEICVRRGRAGPLPPVPLTAKPNHLTACMHVTVLDASVIDPCTRRSSAPTAINVHHPKCKSKFNNAVDYSL